MPPSEGEYTTLRAGDTRVRNTDQVRSWIARECTAVNLLSLTLLVGYISAFISSLDGRWFDPRWTTDDAMQQSFSFYEALYPGRFDDDLVAQVMRGCLPPLHYWIGYAITLLSRDPIMTGHWMMLVQVGGAAAFLFVALRRASATAPALLGIVWFLHARHTIQRMTGGLPRGWTPAIFAAFLYCAISHRHVGALVVILLGTLLNPPAAFMVGLAYGGILLWRAVVAKGDARRVARRRLATSLALAPLFAAVAFAVVQRPPHVGEMVSLQEAAQMPEFQRPKGRFPFLPLLPAVEEFKLFGLQAFLSRMDPAEEYWRDYMALFVGLSLGGIALVGAVRARRSVPVEALFFGGAALVTYYLARVFAFKLFVPDRHIQVPMVFFFISSFCIGAWRAFHVGVTPESLRDTRLRYSWMSVLACGAIGLLVWNGSGMGLSGDANFNYPTSKRGRYYEWLRKYSPADALVACQPTHCDGVQLFAARKAFVTTETSQPFYPRYNLEMRRRSEISLRAEYAETLEELLSLLEPEGITYFVFRRADFTPEGLARANYFPPLDSLVKALASRPSAKFVFNQLSKGEESAKYPFVVFKDSFSVIVDVRALGFYLRERGWAPPQATLGSAMQRHASRRDTIVAQGTAQGSELRS
jgi:hypothetical protein